MVKHFLPTSQKLVLFLQGECADFKGRAIVILECACFVKKLRQGNVFTSVCDSVQEGRSLSQHALHVT